MICTTVLSISWWCSSGQGTPVLLFHTFPEPHSPVNNHLPREADEWSLVSEHLKSFNRNSPRPSMQTRKSVRWEPLRLWHLVTICLRNSQGSCTVFSTLQGQYLKLGHRGRKEGRLCSMSLTSQAAWNVPEASRCNWSADRTRVWCPMRSTQLFLTTV